MTIILILKKSPRFCGGFLCKNYTKIAKKLENFSKKSPKNCILLKKNANFYN